MSLNRYRMALEWIVSNNPPTTADSESNVSVRMAADVFGYDVWETAQHVLQLMGSKNETKRTE